MEASKSNWRAIQRENFTDPQKLADFLELSEDQQRLVDLQPKFVLNLPKRLAEKMRKGTLDDPLVRQFLPCKEERNQVPDFVLDPVGDAQFCRTPRLLHKYHGRALLVCTSACAMHCRYCFRQNFDYEAGEKEFTKELAIIAEDQSLQEIILSGGDPLSLSNSVLNALLDRLSRIPHIKRIRFHSRFLVGIPERIDSDFIDILKHYSFSYWFIVHINHAREIDADVIQALKKILQNGIPVLNQAVLLKGVNDSLSIQRELCETLINHGVFPYYLHQLDRVKGAHHFEVDENLGRSIIEELAKVLPGYGVPKYVREVCSEQHKTPL